eukprot:m.47118 g.47118  ORF g.47118 m.47118 type:complete len:593 (+) comp6848_c0_seq1:319-2097(+)
MSVAATNPAQGPTDAPTPAVGASTKPPRVRCHVCCIAVESDAKLAQHCQGKRHRRAVARQEQASASDAPAGFDAQGDGKGGQHTGPTLPLDAEMHRAGSTLSLGDATTASDATQPHRKQLKIRHPRQQPRTRDAASGPLVHALKERAWEHAVALITSLDGPMLLARKTDRGMTPLMLVVNGVCGPNLTIKARLLDLMLAHGAVPTLGERSKGKTAAMMAAEQNHLDLAKRLEALEPRDEPNRCPLCGEKYKLRGRTPMHFLGDCVDRGTEDNRLIRCFYKHHAAVATTLTEPIFHRVNSCLSFRKELSETMAVVKALAVEVEKRAVTSTTTSSASAMSTATRNQGDMQPIHATTSHGPSTSHTPSQHPTTADDETLGIDWTTVANASKDWHVYDLCCGKSLTTSVTALMFPDAVVTCVDRCPSSQLPHYTEAGLDTRVSYACVDMLASTTEDNTAGTCDDQDASGQPATDAFLDAVHAARGRHQPQRPHVAVLGVHCCGALSSRAIDAFDSLEADCLILLPCCLPRKDDPQFPSTIFSTSMQEEQYGRWADYLRDEAMRRGGAKVATVGAVADVVSIKNILIVASRHSETSE